MGSRYFNTTIKPVIGIFILSIASILFLSISSINASLNDALAVADQHAILMREDIKENLEDHLEAIYGFERKMPLDKIIFDLNMNEIENPLFRMRAIEAFAERQSIRGLVLLKDQEAKIISSFEPEIFGNITFRYYDRQWQNSIYGMYRYHAIKHDDKPYLMIEIPVSGTSEDYSLGMMLDYDYILSNYYYDTDYKISFLAKNGAALKLSDHADIISEIQNEFSATVFNKPTESSRLKENLQLVDFKYYEDYILASEEINGITIVLSRQYHRLNVSNIQYGLTTRIIIFGVLMLAVVATIVYSSQKTKKWIESEKQFLNDIIEMDKLSISELKKEVRFYKDYFVDSKLPILFIDKESYRIINSNQAAVDYYGYTEEELNDMYLSDLCRWESNDAEEIKRMEHHKKSGGVELKAVRLQEGIFNDSELVIVMVIADQVVDIDEDKLKMEVFHEIRSPLQGAVGAVEMIEKATDNFGEYTSIIKRSLDNVLMLTNNVLAHGKLTHQQSRVLYSDFDLVGLIDEVISTTVYQDKHYNLIAGQVQENIDDVLVPMNSYVFKSDAIKLRQILLNLMSNASKYTIDGMINITVDIQRQEEFDIVVFRVIDTGEGLTKQEIDHIFDEYTTLTQNANVNSTGIGLNITRKYVELLDSELHVNSEKGVGTTFSFSMKVKGSAKSDLPDVNKKSVLIVDDDEISCDFLRHLLEKEMNCYVKTLTNETALFTELNHNFYDCLIIDQNLNHFNGIDMVKLIKSSINKRLVEMPIILITASRTKHEFKKLSESNVNDIILKPFVNEEVTTALKKVFSKDHDNKHAACKYVNGEIVDKDVMCETFEAVGKEVFIELISKFNINSNEEILLIISKIEEGDYDKVRSILHRLKGAMSYFAPIKCQKLIITLESLALNESPNFMVVFREFQEAHEELLKELQTICRHI